MIDMGILTVDVLEGWLNGEREYLLGLKTEPEAETLQMEYYQIYQLRYQLDIGAHCVRCI